MLLPSQETIVGQWVTAAIADCPNLEPLTAVVWDDQDFPDRDYPYALLSYTGGADEGADDPSGLNDSGELETRTDLVSNLSVTFVTKVSDTTPTRNQVASGYVRELNARKRSFVAEPMRLANIWVRDSFPIPNVSRLQGKSQWESRGVLDLTLGHAAIVTEQPGQFLTAVVDGSTTPPTPSQTLTIPG